MIKSFKIASNCRLVLREFTHGKQELRRKRKLNEYLSVLLRGMAEGLKKDEIVILRIDGEDLHEFINSSDFESEMVSLFSEIDLPENSYLKDYIIKALEKLKVEQGMPPTSDSWVMNSIVQTALESCDDRQQISQEIFSTEFKRVAEIVVKNLNLQHVIVAHRENIFDGSGIKRLLSNKYELEKTLEAAVQNVLKDEQGKMPKEYLRVALDELAPSTGLPPFGALDEMDKVIAEVLKKLNADDGNIMEEDEFKKIIIEILGSIMLQLESKPVLLSTSSVVHEPFAT